MNPKCDGGCDGSDLAKGMAVGCVATLGALILLGVVWGVVPTPKEETQQEKCDYYARTLAADKMPVICKKYGY